VAQVVACELGISIELSKIIFNFVKFIASKKVWTTNFSSLLCFAVVGSEIRNPGSGMEENEDPRDKHPGSATAFPVLWYVFSIPFGQHWWPRWWPASWASTWS
jgi:hypothetical protein